MDKSLFVFALLVAYCGAQFSGFPLNHPTAKAELDKWVGVGTPDRSEKVEVTFAIKQTGIDKLEELLMDVSSPRSPNYGNYLTFEQIAEIAHAREESVGAVLQMLKSVGVREDEVKFTPAKEYATVKVPVSTVEELFAAEMKVFEREGKQLTRSKTFVMPESLREHVDFVSGVDHFPPASVLGRNHSAGLGFQYGEFVNPQVIDIEYNIRGYEAKHPRNSQGVASFLFQYYSPDDLRLFQDNFGVPRNPIAVSLGYNNKEYPGFEASLDTQYITGVGKRVKTWVEYIPEGFVESWTKLILTLGELAPLVHSISYGMSEAMYPPNYLDRTNQDFMKIALSGRTVLVASGDNGVGCYNESRYMPDFPASSPYVTTVGGTVRTTAAGSLTWSESGGGFSNHFRMPRYQREVVLDYLLGEMVPPAYYFNMTGRAYPDVSAYAVGCEGIWYMANISFAGTSCSAPIIAGVVSLLNDVRLNNRMKPLGFLNPLLYEVLRGRGMIDVTMGANWYDRLTCGGGFRAVPGWDPATGWGSPDFQILKDFIYENN